MMCKTLLVLSLLCAVVMSQTITAQVFDAAISYMIKNENDPNSLKTIAARYFDASNYPKPGTPCSDTTFPASNKLSPLVQQFINQKMIIYGANSITNLPKRYNASGIIGYKGGMPYYKVIGYEADIGQGIANIIANQYGVTSGIQAYFSLTTWYVNATNNIISNMLTSNPPFDAIISGMTSTATWDAYGNGTMIARNLLIDFSCPYQDSVNSVVQGLRPLPTGAHAINVPADLNQTGIIFCAQAETDLATTTQLYFSAATIYYSPNISNDTLYQVCHAYVSPILNALYDAKTSNSKLLYIGAVGQSAGPISVGLRKEAASGVEAIYTPFAFVILLLALMLSM